MAQSERLRLRGLMAIPEHTRDEGVLAAQMARMQALFTELAQQYPSVDTLSMGMTEDLEPAIAHGSTMVRSGPPSSGPVTIREQEPGRNTPVVLFQVNRRV